MATFVVLVALATLADAATFQMKWKKSGRLYGPFQCQNGAEIAIGKARFTVVTRESEQATSFRLRSQKTGKVYGPFECRNGSEATIGKRVFTIVTSGAAASGESDADDHRPAAEGTGEREADPRDPTAEDTGENGTGTHPPAKGQVPEAPARKVSDDGEKLETRESGAESAERNVGLNELLKAADALLAKPVAGLTSEDIGAFEEIQTRSRELHPGLDDAQIRELGALTQKIRETMAAHAAFAEAFVVPTKSRDQYRNRVWPGVAARTGLPMEIWHKVTGMEFVLVEPGTFQMGSPLPAGTRPPHEGPVHTVRLTKPFYLGKYEVTQSQWKDVTGEEPWSGKPCVKANPSHAASYISWEDCQGFLKKLNSQFRVPNSQFQFSLPTEAEWEYACRAGGEWEYVRRTGYARRLGGTKAYSLWDVDYARLRIYAWYKDNASDAGKSYPQRVGGKRPNAWRLYDMHGNVWEWCKDWHGSYPKGNVTDPDVDYDAARALAAGHGFLEYRVFRGGSWDDPAEHCRSTYRYRFTADKQDRRVGCRLAVRLSP